MAGMYAILIDEARAGGLGLLEAVERVDEMLMPVAEQRAAQNRRHYGHLLEAQKRRTPA